ncbi:MAG: metallophosphoesterase [Solirubrobacteraceae bacterium]
MILQLSDPHIGAPDGDPEGDLARAVARARELAPAPDVVLVSGDLAEHGAPEEYARVRELLHDLGAPVLALPGNHDDTATLRAAFPETRHEGGPVRVLTMDSRRPGRDDGALGPEKLAQLDAELADGDGRPAIVALHHPPIATGMPFLDDIGLDAADAEALGAIAARRRVVRIVAGHVHMPAHGMLGATPVLTCPSTWRLRARLRLGAPGYEIEDAPAGFALHVPAGGGLTSHVVTL